MKVQYKVNAKMIVEFEEDKVTDIFKQLAMVQEVFAITKCGMCGSENIKFIVRRDDEENEYYEMLCMDCGARLPFGQKKKPAGELYPKKRWDSLSDGEKENRKDEEEYAKNHYGKLPHDGWFKFKGVKK